MTNEKNIQPSQSRLLLYQTEDGKQRVEVRLQGETVWLSLNQMSELFQRDKSVISRHINNIFNEGELVHDSVVAKFATTAADDKTHNTKHYNLAAIIAEIARVHAESEFKKNTASFRTGCLKAILIG
jgi:hypothetical protein